MHPMQLTHCTNCRLDQSQSEGTLPPIEIKFEVPEYLLRDLGQIATPVELQDDNAEMDLNRSREHLLKHVLLQIRMVDPIYPISRAEALLSQRRFGFKETRVTSRASIENGLALHEPTIGDADRRRNNEALRKGDLVTRQVVFYLPAACRIKTMYPTRTSVNDSIILQVVSTGEDNANPPVLLGTHQEGQQAHEVCVQHKNKQMEQQLHKANSKLNEATNELATLTLRCEANDATITSLKKKIEELTLTNEQALKGKSEAEAREKELRQKQDREDRKKKRRDSDDAKLEIRINSLESEGQQKDAKILTLEEKLNTQNSLRQQLEKNAMSLNSVNLQLKEKINTLEMKEGSSTRAVKSTQDKVDQLQLQAIQAEKDMEKQEENLAFLENKKKELTAEVQTLKDANKQKQEQLEEAEKQRKQDQDTITRLEATADWLQTEKIKSKDLQEKLEKAEEKQQQDAQTIADLQSQVRKQDDSLSMAKMKEELDNLKREMEAKEKANERLLEENNILKNQTAEEPLDVDMDADDEQGLTTDNVPQAAAASQAAAAILRTATRRSRPKSGGASQTKMKLRSIEAKKYKPEDEEEEDLFNLTSSGSEFKPSPMKKKKKNLPSSTSDSSPAEGHMQTEDEVDQKVSKVKKQRYDRSKKSVTKQSKKDVKKDQEKAIPSDAEKIPLFQQVEGKKVPTSLKEACEALANSKDTDYLDQLTCFNKDEMSTGQQILLNLPGRRDTITIPADLCGFKKFASSRAPGWHKILVRFEKEGSKFNLKYFIRDDKGKFLKNTYAEVRKRGPEKGPRPRGDEEPMKAESQTQLKNKYHNDWKDRQQYEEYEREENAPYMVVRTRHRKFAAFPNLELIETQITEAYNLSDDVDWVGKVAMKFQGLGGSMHSYILGDKYMPHPTKHCPDCDEIKKNKNQEGEDDEDEEADDEKAATQDEDDD